MRKNILIALILILGFGGIVFAAPTLQYRQEATLIPISDNAYDLGTTTKRWRNLYVSGTCIGCNLGSATSTNPFMATYFVATSTTRASDLPYASTTALTITGTGHFPSGIWNSSGNVGIGTASPTQSLDVAGFINTNSFSGYKQNGTTILYASSTVFTTFVGQNAVAHTITTANSNATAVGHTALNSLTTGTNNTAIGFAAGRDLTTGSNNMFIGTNAGRGLTTAGDNTAIGVNALLTATSSNRNTAFGSGALAAQNDSAHQGDTNSTNSAFGYAALTANTTGLYNVAVGATTLTTNTTGSFNTAVGRSALNLVSTGSSNIGLGRSSGANITTGSNNTIIGTNISAPVATGSGQLNIGNTIFGTGVDATGTTVDTNALIGIGTSTPTSLFQIANATAPKITLSDTNAALNQKHWFIESDTGRFSIGTTSDALATGTFRPFVITAAGNLGLGTTTPASRLTLNGHFGTDGLTPTLSSCGTLPAITTGSTDTAGEVTVGVIAGGCTVTFASAYDRPPFCTVTSQSGIVFTYTASATALTLTNSGDLSNTKVNYTCIANDL